jgi:uncharacterized cupin superfamily protein
MTDYKKLNLKEDVENMSERFGLAPNMEARFARNAMDLQGGGFSYQKLAPGFQAPFGHKHERQEEVYVIVSGSGRIKIDDDVVDLSQWDVITFAPQKVRAFEAGPDGLELLAIGFGEGGDADMIQDFWSD